MIASRLRRQAILYEPGRDITILIGEGALRTRVASPADHARAARAHRPTRRNTHHRHHRDRPVRGPGPDRHAQRLGCSPTTSPRSRPTPATSKSPTPQHVERYWHHTQLLLDAAATGHDAAALCRNLNDEIDHGSAAA